MKKKLISLFLIVSLFSCVGIAKAADLDEGQTLNVPYTPSSNTIGGLSYNNGVAYNTLVHTATGASGETYDAYCLDPHGVATYGNFTVQPVSNQAFAAGVSAILSGNGSYVAKRTALVAFIYGVGNFAGITNDLVTLTNFYFTDPSTGKGQVVQYSSAFVNSGIEWACQNPSDLSALLSYSGDCVSSLKSMAQQKYRNYNINATAFTGTEATSAYALFAQALSAAASANGGESSEDGTASMTLSATLGNIEVNDDSVVINATFDITDMSSNGYLKNINFTLNGEGYGEPTLEYSVNNGEWQSLTNNSDTNLAESLVSELAEGETASGTVSLRITLSKTTSDDEECTPATFTITYDYTGLSNYQIAILKGQSTNAQSYLVYFATGTESETENSGTLEGEIPCEEGEEVCGTYISTPICSDKEEESSSDIVAPEDIKKCILDNTDDVGNSYKLDSKFGGLDKNDYCDVFCKEDYKDVLNDSNREDGRTLPAHGIILQPKIDDVVCGGYFQLRAHIEGAKDCYTGGNGTEDSENGLKSIDKEAYLEEIQSIENNMVDALTRYNEAVKTLEQLEAAERTEETFSCGGQTVTNVTITTESTEYTGFTFEWNEEDESGSFEEETGNTEAPTFSDNQTCVYDEENDTYYVDGEANAESDYQKKISEVQNNRDSAKADYETAVEEYRENIRMYNECVTGWTIAYDFAQVVRYYYDETYEQDGSYVSTIPYFDLIMGDDEKTILWPDEEGVYEYLVDVEVCKETATNEYECEGDSTTFDNFDEDDVGQLNIITESDVIDSYAYGYDDRYADVFEEKNYVLCKIDGDGEGICDNDTRNISQASFVRKTIKKAQDYISPSVYWQSEVTGKVTASEVEGTESLDHNLPVSTRSVLGGTFRLMLQDLGEFYNDGKQTGDDYGRLIDYMGHNENISVAGPNGISTFDGDYECYYVNNCKPDDCPNCDFTGTGIPDCPNCDFTGDSMCVNCIFNLDELQINVKPITSTEVINPSREYGYNWVVDTSLGRLELISQKAEQTINEIESANETIYSSTKYTDENGLAFSINLTPSIISYLKEYNALHDGGGDDKGDGGYANDSLTCEDAQFGKTTVKNLFCKSEVIDYLLEDEEYRKQIPNVDEFEEKRSDVNSYWTTFPNWEQIVGDELTDAGQNYVIGGPAWK